MFAVSSLLLVACCVGVRCALFVACCVSSVVCRWLCVVCGVSLCADWFAVCGLFCCGSLWRASCRLVCLRFACCLSFAARLCSCVIVGVYVYFVYCLMLVGV